MSCERCNDMKKIIYILLVLVFAWSPAYAADQPEYNPFPQNKSSIYQYGDDIPDICFFPVNKARWNGYEVTAAKWSQLTDYQKVSFISEGAEEIERNEGVKVDIGDGWKLLTAINGGVATLPKDSDVPMIRFLRDLLNMEGSIKPKNK